MTRQISPYSIDQKVVISNGSLDEVEAAVKKLGFDLADGSGAIFEDLNDLFKTIYLKSRKPALEECKTFRGPIIFIFFRGFSFIEKIIGDLVMCQRRWKTPLQEWSRNVSDAIIYFDSSVGLKDHNGEFENFYEDNHQLNYITTVASYLASKMHVMVTNISQVYIQDQCLSGGGDFSEKALLRHCPFVQRVVLSSKSSSIE